MAKSNPNIAQLTKIASNFAPFNAEEEKRIFSEYSGFEKTIQSSKNQDEIDKAKAGQRDIKELLCKHNMRLLIDIAQKPQFMNHGIPLEDLVHEAVTGLYRAVEKFEPSKGFKFSTYATWWIRQRIGRAIEKRSKLVKIPGQKIAQINRINTLTYHYCTAYGGKPSTEELVILYKDKYKEDITLEDVQELGRLKFEHVSLDKGNEDEDNLSMLYYIPSPDHLQPGEQIEKSQDKEYMRKILSYLPEQDRNFIMFKFGFLDGIERSDKEMTIFTNMSAKENKKKFEEIMARLRKLTNMNKVNLNIYYDLILTSYGDDRFETIQEISKLLNISLGSSADLVKNIPCRIANKVTQETVYFLNSKLSSIGAKTTLTKVV